MKYRLPFLVMFLLLTVGCTSSRLQSVQVAPDHQHFVLRPSDRPFVPWGHNGNAPGLSNLPGQTWAEFETQLQDMKDMGANVIRIHLQFPHFMSGPDQPNPVALAQLRRTLRLAEKYGIYLDLTGLACYRRKERAAWYDALPTKERWAQQALFWQAIAQTCASSHAVFCYDLANEPIASGKRSDGWYTGNMGGPDGCDFLQRLSLDEPGQPAQPGGEIVKEWVHTMVTAIHRRDRKHLITIGMLPAWGIPPNIAGQELDFIAVHIYPGSGKVAAALANLKQFEMGKPIVVEETFPLGCGVDDERQFLLESRTIAAGWIGQYPEETLAQLRAGRQAGKNTAGQNMYLQWLELFIALGPQMLAARKEAGRCRRCALAEPVRARNQVCPCD